MSNNKKSLNIIENTDSQNDDVSVGMQLDDTRRVKVQSPGMLIFRRFIRNKLAVVGFVILFFMFFFSFIGSILTPHGQSQVFKSLEGIPKDYAGATYNTELRYTVAEGESFDTPARAQFLLALGKNEESFEHNDNLYFILNEAEGFYRIILLNHLAEVLLGDINPVEGNTISNALIVAYEEAAKNRLSVFEFEGEFYYLTKEKKSTRISTEHNVALAMINIFDSYNESDNEDVLSFDFKLASSFALIQGEDSFSVDNQSYSIMNDGSNITILDDLNIDYAEVSNIIVNPLDQNIFLSVDFKSIIRQTIIENGDRFNFTHSDGTTIDYTVEIVNNTFNIKKETLAEIISMFETPSSVHPLGLDNNGMDVMTRLMYGGQVSLLVGFVVISIELFIGIIIGGVSGYFGGWIDTLLMRFVDLFNSIPFLPLVLILGSVMDTLEVEPKARIFLLMLMLGLFGWTGTARIVRGQILSLRELDFMVATEATGIRATRRIFRHLIPNIMPLLIVSATASLGGIIITEATLGFLGLGVKYPLASWGSIINAASDAYIMTNFWYMWMPAGSLILLTVLGFNFVGDGLRDAFDPKMKR
jgi:peptide/nickel transport system permease protein